MRTKFLQFLSPFFESRNKTYLIDKQRKRGLKVTKEKNAINGRKKVQKTKIFYGVKEKNRFFFTQSNEFFQLLL
jgi:hypothetical protein